VGLKRGCAVAYTDKGTGSGVHDLATNTVNTQNGVRADATVASANSNFTAELTAPELTQFNPWLVSPCTPAQQIA
jgi:hydroxybutyrate-dimer hydrolase